jgi:hypothetical protein
MIWYLLEGYYHRKQDLPIQENTHTRYTVPIDHHDQDLIFYKSKRSEKWWLEIPRDNQTGNPLVMPCSYHDYQRATGGEIPDRLIHRLARLG